MATPNPNLPPFQRGLGIIEVRYENRVPLRWSDGNASRIEYWGTDTVWAVEEGATRVRSGVLCLVQPSPSPKNPMWIRFDSTTMRHFPDLAEERSQ